jgi:hypothetical protein
VLADDNRVLKAKLGDPKVVDIASRKQHD